MLPGRFLDLDARVGLTISGSNVSAWADQSGAGNHLTAPGNAGTQPIASTCAPLGGAVSTFWDGNDQLQSAGLVPPSAPGAAFTWWIVCAYADTLGRAVMATAASGGNRYSQNVSGTGKLEDWVAGVSFSTSSAASRATGLSMVMTSNVSPATAATMRVTGALTTLSNPTATVLTPSGVLTVGSIGGAIYFKGHVCRILGMTGTISATDLALLTAYSLTTYGV